MSEPQQLYFVSRILSAKFDQYIHASSPLEAFVLWRMHYKLTPDPSKWINHIHDRIAHGDVARVWLVVDNGLNDLNIVGTFPVTLVTLATMAIERGS